MLKTERVLPKNLSERLRAEMKKVPGLTQAELARRAGLCPVYLWHLLHAKIARPRLYDAIKLYETLNIPLTELKNLIQVEGQC